MTGKGGATSMARATVAVATTVAAPDAEALVAMGSAHLAKGELVAAHAALDAAWRAGLRGALLRSSYGLTLVAVAKNRMKGVAFCEQAVAEAPAAREVYLNLARAYLHDRSRERAIQALLAGLARLPDDPSIEGELVRLGQRDSPLVPFLDRSNAVNVLAGRLRAWSRRRRRPRGIPEVDHG